MNAVLWLLGGRRVRTDGASSAALLDICLHHSISYHGFCWEENGAISFFLPLYSVRALIGLCETNGVPLQLLECVGLPAFLYRHRRRAGMLLGLLAAIFLTVLSQRFVWDVRVYGNESMSAGEVIAELRDCGFGVGSYIPGLSAPALENRVLIASERISWISIRMDGTVAVVQVIEEVEAPPAEENKGCPANLVAARDGQIEYWQIYRGQPVIVVGQAVREGELLVSGIYDSNLYGYRYTRAAGEVMARTERQLTVEIPLVYEAKIPNSPYLSEFRLQFFDFSAKIFKNSRNEGGACDIIKERIGLERLGLKNLPFYLEISTCTPYVPSTRTRTHEEALELAYRELDLLISELSDSAQILEKRIQTELEEDTLILTCTVSCVENIAVQREFEITEAS